MHYQIEVTHRFIEIQTENEEIEFRHSIKLLLDLLNEQATKETKQNRRTDDETENQ